MIRLILLDLGKVILDFDNSLITERLAAASPLSAKEIRDGLYGSELVRAFDRGELSPGSFYESVRERLRLSLDYEGFVSAWSDIFTPIPDMESLIDTLRERGRRLAVLSNTNRLHIDFIRGRFPVLGRFDALHLSYELGAAKPDPRVYTAVLEAHRVAPGEVFYADDIPEYVSAAASMGLAAVRFQTAEGLENALKAHGVSVT